MTPSIETQLDSNTLLHAALNVAQYQSIKDEFLANCSKGSTLDFKEMIESLVNEATQYCGISKSMRTVCYDIAWSVLGFYEENEFVDFSEYLELNHPEQAQKLDNYDVASLDLHEYFSISMRMIADGEIVPKYKEAFCYALHLLFLSYSEHSSESDFDELIAGLNDTELEDD